MKTIEVEVINRLGLHARPAAKLTQKANEFLSEIKIDKNGYVIVDGNKTKEFWDGYIRSKKKPLRLKIRNICGDETVWEV